MKMQNRGALSASYPDALGARFDEPFGEEREELTIFAWQL
jgi:hypothetical protein